MVATQVLLLFAGELGVWVAFSPAKEPSSVRGPLAALASVPLAHAGGAVEVEAHARCRRGAAQVAHHSHALPQPRQRPRRRGGARVGAAARNGSERERFAASSAVRVARLGHQDRKVVGEQGWRFEGGSRVGAGSLRDVLRPA